MISRDQLAHVVGEENVVTLEFDDGVSVGMSEIDALLLSHVGLPENVGAIFTMELDGPPALFSIQSLDNSDGSVNSAVFIGAPGRNRSMRYFLDVKNSVVVLASLNDENPVTEVVNSSFSNFVDFIHRIAIYFHADDLNPGDEKRSAHELAEYLRQRDPYAFRESNTWWSMAISAIVEVARGAS